MYIKKILIAILLIGVVGGGIFAYVVYSNIFSPNTAFENEKAYLFVSSEANFDEVMEDIAPLLKDVNSFAAVAKRKGYVTCLLYTSPSPRDRQKSRMPSSA